MRALLAEAERIATARAHDLARRTADDIAAAFPFLGVEVDGDEVRVAGRDLLPRRERDVRLRFAGRVRP
mgnify:CR=1 FL=1